MSINALFICSMLVGVSDALTYSVSLKTGTYENGVFSAYGDDDGVPSGLPKDISETSTVADEGKCYNVQLWKGGRGSEFTLPRSDYNHYLFNKKLNYGGRSEMNTWNSPDMKDLTITVAGTDISLHDVNTICIGADGSFTSAAVSSDASVVAALNEPVCYSDSYWDLMNGGQLSYAFDYPDELDATTGCFDSTVGGNLMGMNGLTGFDGIFVFGMLGEPYIWEIPQTFAENYWSECVSDCSPTFANYPYPWYGLMCMVAPSGDDIPISAIAGATAPTYSYSYSYSYGSSMPYGMYMFDAYSSSKQAFCLQLVVTITTAGGTDITETVSWSFGGATGAGIDVVACVDDNGILISVDGASVDGDDTVVVNGADRAPARFSSFIVVLAHLALSCMYMHRVV